MGTICPTVTAYSTEEYNEQLSTVSKFARRIHIDTGDGIFTKKMVGIEDMEFPTDLTVDVHVMHKNPSLVTSHLIALRPHLIVLHAEASGIGPELEKIQAAGLKTGIALLQGTTVKSVAGLIQTCDHVLIFSGSLGSFGGTVDYSLLQKIDEIRVINPRAEIGWDGGINVDNVHQLFQGGVDVLNVGGAIHKANHPENVFRDLERRLYD